MTVGDLVYESQKTLLKSAKCVGVRHMFLESSFLVLLCILQYSKEYYYVPKYWYRDTEVEI